VSNYNASPKGLIFTVLTSTTGLEEGTSIDVYTTNDPFEKGI